MRPLGAGDIFAKYYRVERLLKAGGMGAVYVVQHTETGKRQALKLMRAEIVADASQRARFRQEAQVASLIDDPDHVVDVSHAGIDDETGAPFIVMELLQGEELGARIARVGALPRAEALLLLEQVAAALDRAHEKGVVHRDLKPENLFVVIRQGKPLSLKVLDFGIAKLLQGSSGTATQAAGTPVYMAPEQTSRSTHIGPHSDIWAFGLIVYTSIVGATYWQFEDIAQIYRALIIDELIPASVAARARGVTLPEGFDAWFSRCVNRDVTQRFPTAGEAFRALAPILGGLRGEAPKVVTQAEVAKTVLASETMLLTPEPPPVRKDVSGTMAMPEVPTVQPFVETIVQTPTKEPIGPPPEAPARTQVGPAMTIPMDGLAPAIADVVRERTLEAQKERDGAKQAEKQAETKPSGLSEKQQNWIRAGVVFGALTALTVMVVTRVNRSPAPKSASTTSSTGSQHVLPVQKLATSASPLVDSVLPPMTGDLATANRWIEVTPTVFIQQHEVTRREYAEWVRGFGDDFFSKMPLGGVPLGYLDPLNETRAVDDINFESAQGFCKALGPDSGLPTRDEWRQTFTTTYPWGSDWPGAPGDLAIAQKDAVLPRNVMTAKLDVTKTGIFDLAGNVREWTATLEGSNRVVLGASLPMDETEARRVIGQDPALALANSAAFIGFRCVTRFAE